MKYENIAIPAGSCWSSPFAKWQGSLAETSSLDLAVDVTTRALAERHVDVSELGGIVLGWTVPQPDIFYGAPTLAARIGATGVSGPMVSQACATSVAGLHAAAGGVQSSGSAQLLVTTDRTSNGPQLLYPAPRSPGGAPISTHWVLDSFARDPWAGGSMLGAGDLVATDTGVSRAELDDLAVMRWEQYASALAEDRAFQRRYMVDVQIPRTGRDPAVVNEDEGIRPIYPDEIAQLRPAGPDGLHTFATQTHPADGSAGAIVTTNSHARELARGEGIVRLLSSGFARVGPSRMPEAPVPAAKAALDAAGVRLDHIDAVTTHNPFAVNDVYFANTLGYPIEKMNTYGCSLIFGHPRGPTRLRSIAELIETLRLRGGGLGLFTGCAAGDTGAAVVIQVED